MMKTILAASLLLVACTDNTVAPPAQTYFVKPAPKASPLPELKIEVRAQEADSGVVVSAPESEEFALPTSPCSCATTECVTDWVRDNLGCDIMVDITCEDGLRAGIATCELPPLSLR